jgi:hypothetical protein
VLIAHFLVSPDELMLVCDIHGIYASLGSHALGIYAFGTGFVMFWSIKAIRHFHTS